MHKSAMCLFLAGGLACGWPFLCATQSCFLPFFLLFLGDSLGTSPESLCEAAWVPVWVLPFISWGICFPQVLNKLLQNQWLRTTQVSSHTVLGAGSPKPIPRRASRGEFVFSPSLVSGGCLYSGGLMAPSLPHSDLWCPSSHLLLWWHLHLHPSPKDPWDYIIGPLG